MNIIRVHSNFIKKIWSKLCLPFQEGFLFFLTTFLLSACIDIVGFSLFESFFKGIFIGLHHYVICYLLTLLSCLLPGKWRVYYRIIAFVLLAINFLIDIVCVYSFHFTFDQEVPAILIGTNQNETIEFIHTFIPISLIGIIISFFIAIKFMYGWLNAQKITLSKRIQYTGVALCFISYLTIALVSNKNWKNVSLGKIYTFMQVSTPIDLRQYQVNPNLKHVSDRQPKNVVMIIGESFSKTHSSLYGYDKQTNPYLATLKDKGLLFIFNHVQSPALNTIPVFQSLMSTYKPEYKDSINWYECITLQEILQKVDYHTYWISNQSQKGFHDNVITKYAELCDEMYFVGNRFTAMGKRDFDEIIIDPIKKCIKLGDTDSLSFYFVHLMGSHPDFKKRYPSGFDKFQAEDYPNKPRKQRSQLATYDNSILYNDSIVYTIMNLYKNKEAIIFYFSDHALDVYDSRDDYVGHARYNNKKSAEAGSAIPFMIYMTPLYQKKFPEKKMLIQSKLDTPYRTDNLIYTIMDIIGVIFDDNGDVGKYSLLRK